MSDAKALVAEAREFADRNNGMNWQGVVLRLADALEASVQDAAEVEARGLEKAADDMHKSWQRGLIAGEREWLRARAQQVREGN